MACHLHVCAHGAAEHQPSDGANWQLQKTTATRNIFGKLLKDSEVGRYKTWTLDSGLDYGQWWYVLSAHTSWYKCICSYSLSRITSMNKLGVYEYSVPNMVCFSSLSGDFQTFEVITSLQLGILNNNLNDVL